MEGEGSWRAAHVRTYLGRGPGEQSRSLGGFTARGPPFWTLEQGVGRCTVLALYCGEGASEGAGEQEGGNVCGVKGRGAGDVRCVLQQHLRLRSSLRTAATCVE